MPSRRAFLAYGGSAVLAASVPGIPALLRAAAREARSAGSPRVLVVIQLSGGNDGLNTVIPYTDPLYAKRRPSLAVGRGEVLRIDDSIGLHPALRGAAELVESNRLAVVQGVGYPQPNRSHFESMDIWHTARREPEARATGWLGRAGDAGAASPPAIYYGGGVQPLALAAAERHAASLPSLESLREGARRGEWSELAEQLAAEPRPEAGELLRFIQETERTARRAQARLAEVEARGKGAAEYPATELAGRLRGVARLIDALPETPVYYVTHDGFDTHSNQAAAHTGLLTELGDALAAFLADLEATGHAERTAVLVFSEFGRRVQENASRGTDHGAAAPVFVAGGAVRGGVYGAHPALDDLDDGDLKHHTDFRRVYATLLDRWLGIASAPLLGDAFDPLDLFA